MKSYLPKKLHLDAHLKQYPPTNIDNFNIDNLKYILGLITDIPARSEHFDSNTGMVPLNAQILRKKVSNYKQYLEYAVSTGILISDYQYIPGKKSIGYRFSDQYLDKVESVPIVKYTLVKRDKQDRQIDPLIEKKYPYLTKWFNEDLEIDHTGAIEFLESNLTYDENISKYNYNYSRIDHFKDHEYYISVDGNVNRFHSSITNINSELRRFIKYAGAELVSIDISNSQPYLSIILFNPSFYQNCQSVSPLTLYSICSSFTSSATNTTSSDSSTISSRSNSGPFSPFPPFPPPLMLQEMLQMTDCLDIKRYIELVTNGHLYEYLSKEIKDELGIEYNSRKELKEVIFTVLFTANQFIGQPEAGPKRVFKDRFPTVYKIFSRIKKRDKKELPRLLQRIESHIVLDRICKRIAQERPWLPIFTIHDSVITTIGNEGYVEAIMIAELSLCIGHEPTLKIEHWAALRNKV